MVVHDLTHYVVETQLKVQDGFYGLLARGLDITDFEKKQKITPASIPAEGIRMEILVGLLLTERNDGRLLGDFNDLYLSICQKFQLPKEPLPKKLLAPLRNGIDETIKNWNKLPVGSCLLFNFPAH